MQDVQGSYSVVPGEKFLYNRTLLINRIRPSKVRLVAPKETASMSTSSSTQNGMKAPTSTKKINSSSLLCPPTLLTALLIPYYSRCNSSCRRTRKTELFQHPIVARCFRHPGPACSASRWRSHPHFDNNLRHIPAPLDSLLDDSLRNQPPTEQQGQAPRAAPSSWYVIRGTISGRFPLRPRRPLPHARPGPLAGPSNLRPRQRPLHLLPRPAHDLHQRRHI